MRTWEERHKAARDAVQVPEHAWFQFKDEDPVMTCARCGLCRPSNPEKLKPCPGTVRIALR